MKRNKYLEALGISIKNYGSNFIKKRKLQRFFERRKYGFDFRETINMDLMFAEWLYSRLTMLKEQTMGDLNFHLVVFEGRIYTIEQGINRILKAAKEYLCHYEIIDTDGEEEISEIVLDKIVEEMKTATRMWAEIMTYCDRVV